MPQNKLSDKFFVLMLCCSFFINTISGNECLPVTWTAEQDISTGNATRPSSMPRLPFDTNFHVTTNGTLQPGQVVCRYYGHTGDTVNCCTCRELSDFYKVSLEHFFVLNPDIQKDCSNIKPRTQYCTRGWIQPVVSTDGFCGPQYGNATCELTDMPCCNSQTWKCGNSTDDCAPGTCWEGLCYGHKVYSIDGKCGIQNNNVLCAGRWGSCCSLDGFCGNGTDFCGEGRCHSGDCVTPAKPPQPPQPSNLESMTLDGTCGPSNGYICSVFFGNCCNKDNVCGSLPQDCSLSQGCQPKYGSCDDATTRLSSPSTISASSSARNWHA